LKINGIQEVDGSIPFSSTLYNLHSQDLCAQDSICIYNHYQRDSWLGFRGAAFIYSHKTLSWPCEFLLLCRLSSSRVSILSPRDKRLYIYPNCYSWSKATWFFFGYFLDCCILRNV